MRKRIDGGEKRRERRKEAKKEETKEEKNGRPRGPVRPRKWKRRREMAVSIIPETMTDRHRYSGWKPSRIRDKDGDTLTPGINLSKDEAAVSVVNSGIPTSFAYIYIYIYALLRAGNDACWSTDSMDGIERWLASLARSQRHHRWLDGRYATGFRLEIDLETCTYSLESVNIRVERVRFEYVKIDETNFPIIIYFE